MEELVPLTLTADALRREFGVVIPYQTLWRLAVSAEFEPVRRGRLLFVHRSMLSDIARRFGKRRVKPETVP